MNTRTKLLAGGCVSLLLLIIALFALLGGTRTHQHHHATCWAKPGVFADTAGGWVARYTPAGTRHGRGATPGVCNR